MRHDVMNDDRFHLFDTDVTAIELPHQFTCPFNYAPHPLSQLAAAQVQRYVASRGDWADELGCGKMLGVLVARDTTSGVLGFVAAFSGNLAAKVQHPYFVPPVYDLLDPQGEFKQGEARITAINHRLQQLQHDGTLAALRQHRDDATTAMQRELQEHHDLMVLHKQQRDQRRAASPLTDDEREQLLNQSRHDKAQHKRLRRQWQQRLDDITAQIDDYQRGIDALKRQRRQLSVALQERIFRLFVVTNARGEQRDLVQVFAPLGTLPPAGAGECCAPRLLNHAYRHGLQPLCMAEFWWGASPVGEVRHHGHYYPACRSKCKPILEFMLQGLDVEPNPLAAAHPADEALDIVHDDQWLTVVNKPAGMLTVPGKLLDDCLLQRWHHAFPTATGPMVVHRLDQETSGLVVLAKDKQTHRALQQQFERHTITKHYVALLDGTVTTDSGEVSLPLIPDIDDRPRQRVDLLHGKPALTRWRVLERHDGITRVLFTPLTGRTHQLRVHASHPQGLGCPIVGDRLYGTASTRLMLHAATLTLTHPATGQTLTLRCRVPF